MPRPGLGIRFVPTVAAVVFACSVGNAQVIYSNSFSGGAVTIDTTAPTVANTLLGGSSSAKWISTFTNGTGDTVLANGAITTNGGCAILPFTPQPGCVYFMTASLTVPSGMPNWVAMGFTQLATQTNNANGLYSRFTDNPPRGYGWIGIREGTGGQNVLYGGPYTQNSAGTCGNALPSAGTYTR
jgi:hypothetical protein